MKMYFTKALGVCCTLTMMMFGLNAAIAQDCENSSQWPSGAINLNNDGEAQTISTCNYAEEYSVITNVEAGADYEFSVADNFITVREGAVDGPVIATGASVASVSGASGSDLFVHWTVDSECTTAASCISTSVQCTSCSSPLDCEGVEGGSALPGTACDDGNPATIGSEWNEECECTGGTEPAVNSECADALPVECGLPVSGSTVGASNDDLPDCGTSNGTGGGVWYTFIAPYDGTATYDLCDTDYDSKIRIFSGSCEALECVTGNDDSFTNCGSGGASFATSDITAGATYYILIHGFGGNEGNFTLNLTCEEAPEFECEELEANIGDSCELAGFFDTTIDENCECTGTPYDCTALEANIGDACDDGNPLTEGSTLDEECGCTGGTEIVFEGCTNTGFNFGSANPECNSSALVEGAWAYEDATITVVSGDDYIFTVSNPDYFVTIADENDNILAFGQETASWTSTLDGNVFFFSHVGPGCPTTSGSATEHIKTIERVCEISSFDCPELEANVGDDCGENGTVSEGCECVEPLFECPELEANIGDDCGESGTVSEDCACVEPIANDDCANAAPISCGGSVSGSTVGANSEDLPECGTTNGTGGGVWYTYTAPFDGTATYDLCNSDFDTKIRVWTGSCEALECVGGNDDLFAQCGSGNASYLEADITAGTTYYILVHGFSANEGNFTLNLSCEEAPEFECPLFEANIGDPCDDGDIFTEGTTLDENCECTGGTPIVFEGCTNGDAFSSRAPECSGPAAVQSGAWTAEYVVVTVEEGIDYTFTISNPDYFATVSTNDSVANVLAFGQESTSWTSTFDGTVRFYSHAGPGCPETTGSPTSHTRTIQAGACNFDCPTEEANIGDPCEIAGFFDATIDENCECVGTPFDCDADGEFSNIGDPCMIEGEGGSFNTSVATEAVGNPTTFEANASYNFTVPSGFSGDYDLNISAVGETFNGSWRSEYRVRVSSPDGTNVTEGAPGGAADEWQPTSQTQGGEFTGDVTLEGLSGIEGEWTVEVRMSFNEGETINAIVDLVFDFVPAATDGIVDENCECIVPCLSVGGELAIEGSDRVCVGTGSEVTFDNAVLTGAAGDNSIWVLTEGNTNVLATDATGPNFDFDGLSASGIYKIRHISYANDVDINAVLANPLTTEGCWEVSNSIRVFTSALPEPGTIELLNASNELCTGQGPASYAAVAVTGEDMSGSRYVLADENGDVVGVKADPFFNLNNRTPGTYTIYRAAWATGFAPTANGNNVNDPGTCVALSNGVEVILSDCDASAAITSNPNPTAGESWVTFSVDEPQQVQVEVYDMAGRHIKTVFNQNAAGGQDYRMQFDGTSLPNGVYMYRMTTESQVIVDKFMIAR